MLLITIETFVLVFEIEPPLLKPFLAQQLSMVPKEPLRFVTIHVICLSKTHGPGDCNLVWQKEDIGAIRLLRICLWFFVPWSFDHEVLFGNGKVIKPAFPK